MNELGLQQKREKRNARLKTDRDNLAGWYVRKLLIVGTCLQARDIPVSMVECKRAHLMLIRAIREKRKLYN